MQIVDFERLERQAPALRAAFATAAPYAHIVLDDFLTPEAAGALLAEFGGADENWTAYNHYNERKAGLTRFELMGPQTQATIEALHSERFIAWLEQVSGVSNLLSDPISTAAGCTRSSAVASSTCMSTFSRTPRARRGAGSSISCSI